MPLNNPMAETWAKTALNSILNLNDTADYLKDAVREI